MKRIYIKTVESPINYYKLNKIILGSDYYFEVIKKPKYGLGEEHFTSEDTEPEALAAIADAYLNDCREAYE